MNVSENTSLMDSILQIAHFFFFFLPVGPSQRRVRENTRSFRRNVCKVNCRSRAEARRAFQEKYRKGTFTSRCMQNANSHMLDGSPQHLNFAQFSI